MSVWVGPIDPKSLHKTHNWKPPLKFSARAQPVGWKMPLETGTPPLFTLTSDLAKLASRAPTVCPLLRVNATLLMTWMSLLGFDIEFITVI